MTKASKYLIILCWVIGCIVGNAQGKEKLSVGAWVPYWIEKGNFRIVQTKLDYFDEVSPFAFEVRKDGALSDSLDIDGSYWKSFLKDCRTKKIKVIPAILWTDPQAMHLILGDPARRHQHIEQIITLIDKNDFAGVDIDYEGKDMADRDAFSNFIIELSAAVRNKGYLLYCTIEPRTTDAPPPGWKGTTAMAWADDYHVLNKYCDKVRIMAYDQFVQTKGGKIWKDTVQQPFVPNADINWVEEVLKYSLQSISPHKIFLGVPTYSWEFTMSGKPGNWEYQSMQSLSYSQALELAHSKKTSPLRNPDGELYFAYEDNGVRHLVSVSDSQSMRAKIELAQKYGIYGIVFFKMDGLVDNGLWDVMNAK